MFVRALLSVFVCTTLAGCATTPVPLSQAKQVPADRLLAFQGGITGPSAKLSVTRDAGFLGGGCYLALVINGKLAARFDTGEVANFDIAPGEVLLRVGGDPLGKGMCAIGQSNYWTQRETILHPDETKYFRLTISDGGMDIHRAE